MTINRSKRHHYLPQSYLRKFASRHKGSRYYIWQFDKTNRGRVEVEVANACCENQFHELVDSGGQRINLEDWFTKTEERLMPFYFGLCANPTVETLKVAQEPLAILMAFLMLRSAKARKDIEDFIPTLNKVGRESGLWGDSYIPELTGDALKHEHLLEFLTTKMNDTAARLWARRWVLFLNNTAISYITSDYPFAISHKSPGEIWPIDQYGLPDEGLLLTVPGAQLFFPLTPRLVLALLDWEQDDNIPDIGYPEIASIIEINRAQVFRSMRFLYSSNDDFRDANKTIDERPLLGKKDEPRWKVKVLEEPYSAS